MIGWRRTQAGQSELIGEIGSGARFHPRRSDGPRKIRAQAVLQPRETGSAGAAAFEFADGEGEPFEFVTLDEPLDYHAVATEGRRATTPTTPTR